MRDDHATELLCRTLQHLNTRGNAGHEPNSARHASDGLGRDCSKGGRGRASFCTASAPQVIQDQRKDWARYQAPRGVLCSQPYTLGQPPTQQVC